MLKGVAASAGIGIGRAVLIREEQINVEKRVVLHVEEEKARFQSAVEVFISELEQASELVLKNVGPSEAAILGAQIAIINDPELTREVLRTIERQQINAEYAFNLICNGYIAMFSNLADELIAARAADFQDIRDRMLRILLGIHKIDLSSVPSGSVLVADDIPPSQAAGISCERIEGIITKRGTKFSHIAIIARALRLPAVVSVDGLFDAVEGGETIVVDGHGGYACVEPDEGELARYRAIATAERDQSIALSQYRSLPTATTDGRSVRLASNLAVERELDVILENNADGVGLFRSEFLFMDRKTPPTEQEQFEVYRRLAEELGGKPVVIRTLDIGGDKDIPYLYFDKEDNPFLGHRAVRYCLTHPEFFKEQLAALLRAAVYGNVHIMIPMISGVCELRAVRALISEAAAELEARGEAFRADVPLGVMIETPAAVMCAGDLAEESSFFSIGTNDLTQYVLAVDRGNSDVAPLYNPMHPAVLRMIALTVADAHSKGVPVSVCGEAASDPLLIPFLIGVGVDELSVSSSALLAVRSRVNSISFLEWQRRVPEILSLRTSKEVRELLAARARPNR